MFDIIILIDVVIEIIDDINIILEISFILY